MDNQKAVRVLLRGLVQGVGLRPALLRWASACGVAGWCVNTTHGVEVHVEGQTHEVDQFIEGIQHKLPAEALLRRIETRSVTIEACQGYTIRKQSHTQPPATAVPVDLVICDECAHELKHAPRRQGYPFNSCTWCGPRYSLIRAMPFERGQTAMDAFPLCEQCRTEYGDPVDRRFHAQTMSCTRCGLDISPGDTCENSIDRCIAALSAGQIVAIKGVGGYQLICDATQPSTVARLRQLKARPRKPLAIMVRSIDQAALIARVDGCQTALTSRANPIVLCPARSDSPLANDIHPGLSTIGIMLPTTALHHMLCEGLEHPLVATSGNREGEPLVYTNVEAEIKLASLSDMQLHHNREIVRPIDDSVVRVYAGHSHTIRLARGLAPLTLPVNITEQMVAVGGQQKVALAVSNGNQSILGPHLGEVDSLATQQRFQEQYHSLCQLYGCQPRYIVHDVHPDYFTTQWAAQQAIHTIGVQHHHAHIASGMLEHDWLDNKVLGIAFDGTGWGADGTIWGGEVLSCTSDHFSRVGSLRPFPLIGGELAIHQPQRVALALLHESITPERWTHVLERCRLLRTTEPLFPVLGKKTLHLSTSSMGRLFDGVAAIILNLAESTYEGEPAAMLEAACDLGGSGTYDLPWVSHQWDWRPLIEQLVNDILRDVPAGIMAMRFHRGVAHAVVSVMKEHINMPIVLSGGCFQNNILVDLIIDLLDHQQDVGFCRTIPCNDGGLAAGQLVVAASRLKCLER